MPEHWNDPNVIQENAEPPRAHFLSYPSAAEALIGDVASNTRLLSLDGLWKFRYSPSPAHRPEGFHQPAFDVSGWGDLPVPANWERQGHGYPIYVNVPYPFEVDEPWVPRDNNPVGSYRRNFEVPESWADLPVYLKFGSVSSAFYVWLNGHYVGYSEGSKTPAEFAVGDYLRPGANTIAVEVYRWSSGSYLEDQDFWSLSGIQRGVSLELRPLARIRDYFVHAGLANGYRDGQFAIDLDLVNDGQTSLSRILAIEIRDQEKVVFTEQAALSLPPGATRHQFSATLAGIRAWSAEQPNLYTLLIVLAADTDDLGAKEAVAQRIGFRTVEINNRQFLVNGQPVRLKGVNLHEHHHETGHVVDEATMLQDIRLMKAANMNAVRNSHYPHQERWYELASEHGLYVVDEANIESHGFGYEPDKTLGNKPRWMPHHVDRVRRMLERSKNFPAVVIWSLGNEAGDGVNLGAAYDWVKARDASRPVQYETEGDLRVVGARHSDFHSSMYWRHQQLEAYANSGGDRPFLLIEYAHSMGNSTGNLVDYWDVIKRHDVLVGGFIWDWVDQGLLEHDQAGEPYWTYGGDYGPPGVPSSGNFNMNGILFPDRGLQPAYWEVKRVYQHVDFVAEDLPNGIVGVANNYAFTGLSNFELLWDVVADGVPVHRGSLGNLDIDAASKGRVRLPLTEVALTTGPEHHLDLRLVAPDGWGLLPAGHVLAEAQFLLSGATGEFVAVSQGLARDNAPTPLAVHRSAGALEITGNAFSVSFSTATGFLSSLTWQGQELLLAPLAPNFWRAPTDNDFGNYMPRWAAAWEQASRNCAAASIDVVNASDSQALVVAEYRCSDDAGQAVANWHSRWTIHANGRIDGDHRFEKLDKSVVVPRVGMNMELVPVLDRVEWFGRGPLENYVDRQRAADVARYRNKVADHYVAYMRPQENGYKTDVRWLSLSDGRDAALLVLAGDTIGFSVHHNRLQDFVPPMKIAITSEDGADSGYNPERINMHVNDITPRPLISVNLDYGQMGVGGDDSWGARTHTKYSLTDDSYRYRFTLRPYTPTAGRLDALVSRVRAADR